jgi:hypothetical protein
MLANRPHGVGLGSLLARLLGKFDLGADLQPVEGGVQDAVSVEVQLPAVGRFEESEMGGCDVVAGEGSVS